MTERGNLSSSLIEVSICCNPEKRCDIFHTLLFPEVMNSWNSNKLKDNLFKVHNFYCQTLINSNGGFLFHFVVDVKDTFMCPSVELN